MDILLGTMAKDAIMMGTGTAKEKGKEKAISTFKEMISPEHHKKLFCNCLSDALKQNNIDMDISDQAYKIIKIDWLSAAQSVEQLMEATSVFWDKYFLYENETKRRAVIMMTCQTYLDKVSSEITDADVFAKMEDDKTQILESVNELLQEQKRNELNNIRRHEELKKMINDFSSESSCKEYAQYFTETLFLDEDVYLSDAYIEPLVKKYGLWGKDEWLSCYADNKKPTEYIKDFLDSKNEVLVISGAPGIGKSSLLYKMAADSMNDNYHFLTLSDLECREGLTIEEAFKNHMVVYDEWKKAKKKDSIVFFDGYDEIEGSVEFEEFETFIKGFTNKNVKVIITTRPGYIEENDKWCGMNLEHYDLKTIEQWVENYCSLKNKSDAEKKIEDINSLGSDTVEILGIPIFLYMVMAEELELDLVTNKTKMYEQLFWELNRKRRYGDSEEAEKTAGIIGFFLQEQSNKRFEVENKEAVFKELYKYSTGKSIHKGYIKHLVGNSYIKDITEGTRSIEFYHKSIQDYFSAKYIVERIIYMYDNDSLNGVNYYNLLCGHTFGAEFEHISYLFENKVKDIEGVAKKLQAAFKSVLIDGIPRNSMPWNKMSYNGNKNQMQWGNLKNDIKHFIRNHCYIMDNIKKPVLEQDDMKECGESLVNMIFLSTNFNSNTNAVIVPRYAGTFWRLYKYLTVDQKTYFFFTSRLFGKTIMCRSVTAKQVNIQALRIAKEENLSGHFMYCDIDNVCVLKGQVRHLELEGCSIRNTKIHENESIDSNILECDIEECTFESKNLERLVFEKTNITQTIFKCRSDEKKMTDITFKNCRLDGVVFVSCDFKNVKFINCEFKDCSFKNCKGSLWECDCTFDNTDRDMFV